MMPLIESRKADLEALCRRLRARRLEVFGSAASGRFDPERSDLDFLVEFEPMAPRDYAGSYFAFKEALESMFGREVDLLTREAIENPYLLESIERSRQLLYAA